MAAVIYLSGSSWAVAAVVCPGWRAQQGLVAFFLSGMWSLGARPCPPALSVCLSARLPAHPCLPACLPFPPPLLSTPESLALRPTTAAHRPAHTYTHTALLAARFGGRRRTCVNWWRTPSLAALDSTDWTDSAAALAAGRAGCCCCSGGAFSGVIPLAGAETSTSHVYTPPFSHISAHAPHPKLLTVGWRNRCGPPSRTRTTLSPSASPSV